MNERACARAAIIAEIRRFFAELEFLETDTPALVFSPGLEPHIRPMRIGNAFLHTSPEFAMKKILARGFERIFQICRCYRLEPKSATHMPEFTMLEWYRAQKNSQAGFETIMNDAEALFESLARKLFGATAFETEARGRQDVARPWPRFTIEECFREFAGLELTQHLKTEDLAWLCVERGWTSKDALTHASLTRPGAWDDLFYLVMLNGVEPALAKLGKPAIVYLYPESQAALANLTTDSRGFRWAKRFEIYAGGLELANAFDELTDAQTQRARFEKDMALRRALYGDAFPQSPIDEEFLAALASMPPSAGIALGVDRLAMYFTGATDIREVLWQEPY
ncbi:MAG: EF-P lysine aminoacylase GenX [Deltaproteobacteria bacterium]|nr:EF-P lysine aminoacylase GenX [Deltaproteobacteria bacterium]